MYRSNLELVNLGTTKTKRGCLSTSSLDQYTNPLKQEGTFVNWMNLSTKVEPGPEIWAIIYWHYRWRRWRSAPLYIKERAGFILFEVGWHWNSMNEHRLRIWSLWFGSESFREFEVLQELVFFILGSSVPKCFRKNSTFRILFLVNIFEKIFQI